MVIRPCMHQLLKIWYPSIQARHIETFFRVCKKNIEINQVDFDPSTREGIISKVPIVAKTKLLSMSVVLIIKIGNNLWFQSKEKEMEDLNNQLRTAENQIQSVKAQEYNLTQSIQKLATQLNAVSKRPAQYTIYQVLI